MTTTDKTGLEIEEHGATQIVRINGGKHAVLSPDIASQLGTLVDRADKDPCERSGTVSRKTLLHEYPIRDVVLLQSFTDMRIATRT